MKSYDESNIEELLLEFEGGEEREELTPELLREKRLNRLSRIFSQKITMLKSAAIDKPYMKSSKAIEDQYATYEAMYRGALRGQFSDKENQEIISAHDAAEQALAPFVLLMNNVRAKIEYMIVNDIDGVDEIMDKAEGVTLSLAEATDEKLAELKSEFGL